MSKRDEAVNFAREQAIKEGEAEIVQVLVSKATEEVRSNFSEMKRLLETGKRPQDVFPAYKFILSPKSIEAIEFARQSAIQEGEALVTQALVDITHRKELVSRQMEAQKIRNNGLTDAEIRINRLADDFGEKVKAFEKKYSEKVVQFGFRSVGIFSIIALISLLVARYLYE